MARHTIQKHFLREWREQSGMSGTELSLAAEFGNKSYVSVFENGERPITAGALAAYAKVFGVEPSRLLEPPPPRRPPVAGALPPASLKASEKIVRAFVEELERIPDDDHREEVIDSVRAALARLTRKGRRAVKPKKRKA